MSKTCSVYVGLEHGILIGAIPSVDGLAMDSNRVFLDFGFNENVPAEPMQRWLVENRQLATVRMGLVRVIPDDVLAVDSSSNRKK